MTRPLQRLRLLDLTDTQIGALLAAYRRPLRFRKPASNRVAGWIPDGLDTRIDRRTFEDMQRLGLAFVRGDQTGALTPKGFALAEHAVTLSRQIAAGVAGRDARSLLPVVAADEVLEEPDATALRFTTRRTPRDVITAQLARAKAEPTA